MLRNEALSGGGRHGRLGGAAGGVPRDLACRWTASARRRRLTVVMTADAAEFDDDGGGGGGGGAYALASACRRATDSIVTSLRTAAGGDLSEVSVLALEVCIGGGSIE